MTVSDLLRSRGHSPGWYVVDKANEYAVLRGPHKTEASTTDRRRLNPAFVCWLMGWPWWWTRAEPINFAAQEMESWRSRALLHLSNLFGD